METVQVYCCGYDYADQIQAAIKYPVLTSVIYDSPHSHKKTNKRKHKR